MSNIVNRLRLSRRGHYLRKTIETGLNGLERDFSNLKIPKFNIETYESTALGGPVDVEFQRDNQTIHIGYRPMKMTDYIATYRQMLHTFFYWYMNCSEDVGPILVNCSDGETVSIAKYAASGYRPDVITLPDPFFFRDRGYRAYDDRSKIETLDWANRSDEIVWRGSLNGSGFYSFDDVLANHPGVNQRVRFAQKVNNTDVDFKFVWQKWDRNIFPLITRVGLAGDIIDEKSWGTRKFAIDIDGYTNAWSNLFIRFKLGCCVFKVQSDYGYRQWYYDRLIPFENYIPVRADLSDWDEMVEWAKSHPSECEAIAKSGQELANSMTFETETAWAARRIEATWNL